MLSMLKKILLLTISVSGFLFVSPFFSSPQALALVYGDLALLAENNVHVGQNSNIDGNAASNSGNMRLDSLVLIGEIYAGGDVSVGSNADVNGKIVSNGSATINSNAVVNGVLNSGGNTVIDQNADINSDIISSGTTQMVSNSNVTGNLLSGSHLTLGQLAKIQGDAGVNGNATLSTGAKILGHVTHSGSLALNGTASVGSDSVGPSTVVPESFSGIALPLVTLFSAGGGDVTKGFNESTTLAPGTYGNLLLGEHNTLNLSSGTYFFDSFNADNHLDLNLDLTGGNLLLYILDDVILGQNLDLVLTNGSASDLFLETHGKWEMDSIGNWHGTVFAPFGDIIVGQNSNIFGAFYSGNEIDIHEHVDLNFRLYTPDTPVNPQPPSNHLVPEPSTIFLLGAGVFLASFFKGPGSPVSKFS